MANKLLSEKEWTDSVQQIWDECIRKSIEEQIKEAVEAEREACAKMCEDLEVFNEDEPGRSAANAIRARGQS